MNAYTALVLSLPTRDSTVRMRVWRALKDTGCGVLRDGVYVLPKAAPTASALPEVEAQVHSAGGFGMIVDLELRTAAQAGEVRKLFDRSRGYGELVEQIHAAKAGLAKLGERQAESRVERLQRAFDELATIDFYPGEAKVQAGQALEALRREGDLHLILGSDALADLPRWRSPERIRELATILVQVGKALSKAHERGMLVILDVVTNHVGQLFYYDINGNGQPDDTISGGGFAHTCLQVCSQSPSACTADELDPVVDATATRLPAATAWRWQATFTAPSAGAWEEGRRLTLAAAASSPASTSVER